MTDITWTGISNATYAAGPDTLTSTYNYNNSGGYSQDGAAGEVVAEFEMETSTNYSDNAQPEYIFGLSDDWTTYTVAALDYCVQFQGSNTCEVRYQGAYQDEFTVDGTEVIRFTRNASNQILVHQDGVLRHTFATTTTATLRAKVAFFESTTTGSDDALVKNVQWDPSGGGGGSSVTPPATQTLDDQSAAVAATKLGGLIV